MVRTEKYQSSKIRTLFLLVFRNQFHGRHFGRKIIDPLILLKMLVLQKLFNLIDEEVEFQVNDRRMFKEFIGLGIINDIPDATAVAFLESYLRDQGLEARGGQILSDSHSPKARMTYSLQLEFLKR